MANAAGMLKESIWRDKEFRALPRTAQTTYAQLVSQKELDRAGMQPLQVAKWAKGCDEITESDFWDDLKVLEAHRFVFVDEDTDELFVRSYMRHCEVVRYPNILKNALRCATMVASAKLRHELATELRRLRKADAEKVAVVIDPPEYTEPQRNQTEPLPNPTETVREGLNGSGTVLEPQGYGPGSGKGSSSVVGHLGEGRDPNTVPTKTAPAPTNPPPLHCPKHMPDGTTEPCAGCGHTKGVRREWDNQQRLAEIEQQRAFRAEQAELRQAAIANCGLCNPDGYRGAMVCDHIDRSHQPAREAAMAALRSRAPSYPSTNASDNA